jgi:hypothetical protein
MYLDFSGFAFRPTSLLAANKASVFCLWYLCFYHDINVISIGQRLVCSVPFQPISVLLDPPNGVFQSNVEKMVIKCLLVSGYSE